jgi:hypothetical protein
MALASKWAAKPANRRLNQIALDQICTGMGEREAVSNPTGITKGTVKVVSVSPLRQLLSWLVVKHGHGSLQSKPPGKASWGQREWMLRWPRYARHRSEANPL